MSRRPDYCPIGNEPCQSLCDTPCGTVKRRPLTDEQCKDLLTAAFFIAAKDDVTALIMDEDAERIIKLLCELSGFEPPTHGIEPEQGEVKS